MQIVASMGKSDLVPLNDFSIIRASIPDFAFQTIAKKMLRSLKYLFGAGLVLVANPCVILADELGNAAKEAAESLVNGKNGEATTGLIKTITNAFEGGEVAAKAHQELWALAGNATLIIAVMFIAFIVASYIGRLIGGMVTKRVDKTLGTFLTKAIRNVVLLVVAMVALQATTGADLSAFAAIVAALGFAVGMALQGTLGNFAAGIMLLMFRPFKIDDYIVVADTEGTVEEIDLFTTRLNSLDNRHVIIPNGEIFGAKLENYTRNEVRRVDVNVGAAYSADLNMTREALNQAVAEVVADLAHNGQTGAPMPQVVLQGLGASSVDWQLRVWCSPQLYWGVHEKLTGAAKAQLDAANIGIPFPQMDVHVVGKVLAKAA